MVKITNVFGDRYSGQAGKAGVFANWKGRQYRRAYVIPSNPNTTKQQAVRNNLSNSIAQWHSFTTLMRRAYSYMAAGLIMSGFNLFVRRWQKAMPTSAETMIAPSVGIKCIGHTLDAKTKTNPVPTNGSVNLGAWPVVIGSAIFTPDGDDVALDAYIEIQQGFVRIPTAIDTADGAKGIGATLEEGDQLCISYESSGRIVTQEVLATLGDAETEFPALATMALALATIYSPIDYGTAKVYVHDIDGGASAWTQLESMEIDPVGYPEALPIEEKQSCCFFDLTAPAEAASAIGYNSYTPISDVKLEATKSDTTFIAWRDYSDSVGQLAVAFTSEDETYDLVYSKTGHTNVIATAKPAPLAALTQFVNVGVPA